MDKLSILFIFLVSLCLATCQTTYVKYSIDGFAVTQPDIIRTDTSGSVVNVEQTDSSAQGGSRIVSGWVFPSTISIGSGRVAASITGTYGSSLYFAYRSMDSPVDRSDAKGVQLFITNTDTLYQITISIAFSSGGAYKTITNFPANPNGFLLQIPYSDFTINQSPDFAHITQFQLGFVVYGKSFTFRDLAYYDDYAPVNSEFSGAIGVVPTATVAFDNSNSPSDVSLTQCSDLSSASSFLWYKIEPTNTIRVISVDTCNTPFDTVIGVFSGTSENNLQVVGCNDDSTNLGYGCNPTSSLISDINIAAGEVIYVVVGGYIDSVTLSADAGEGSISFTLEISEDVGVDLEMLVQQREIIEASIGANTDEIIDRIDALDTSLTETINDGDDAIVDLITTTATALSDAVSDVQEDVDSITTTLNDVSTNVDALSESVDDLSTLAESEYQEVMTISAAVEELTGAVDTLSDNVDTSFDNVGDLLDTLQGTANNVQTGVASLQTSSAAIQTAVGGVSNQISTFSSATSDSLSSLSTSVGNVNTAVGDVSSQLSTSTTGIQNAIANVKSDTGNALNILTPLQNNIRGDMFTQTYINYLSDSGATAPLNIRMPNEYGGKMDDIATAVVALYTDLRSRALAIGAKGSTACNNSGFCSYFLGTAEPAYLDAMSKYTSNLAAKKFKTAYTNLQKSYTSLYPAAW